MFINITNITRKPFLKILRNWEARRESSAGTGRLGPLPNHGDVSPHPKTGLGSIPQGQRRGDKLNAGEGGRKGEPSYTAGWNAN